MSEKCGYCEDIAYGFPPGMGVCFCDAPGVKEPGPERDTTKHLVGAYREDQTVAGIIATVKRISGPSFKQWGSGVDVAHACLAGKVLELEARLKNSCHDMGPGDCSHKRELNAFKEGTSDLMVVRRMNHVDRSEHNEIVKISHEQRNRAERLEKILENMKSSGQNYHLPALKAQLEKAEKDLAIANGAGKETSLAYDRSQEAFSKEIEVARAQRVTITDYEKQIKDLKTKAEYTKHNRLGWVGRAVESGHALDDLTKLLEERDRRIEELEKKVAERTSELFDARNEIQEFKIIPEARDIKNAALKARLEATEKDLAFWKAEGQRMEQILIKGKSYDDRDHIILEANAEISKLKARIKNLEMSHKVMAEELGPYVGEFGFFVDGIKKLKAHVKELESSIIERTLEVEGFKKHKCFGYCGACRDNIESADRNRDALMETEARVGVQRARAEKAEDSARSWAEGFSRCKSEIAKLEAELTKAESKLAETDKNFHERMGRFSKWAESEIVTRSNIDGIQISELESELKEAKSEALARDIAHTSELGALRKECAKVEGERNILYGKLEDTIEALKNRCPCWGGEPGNPEGHSRDDCPQKKARLKGGVKPC